MRAKESPSVDGSASVHEIPSAIVPAVAGIKRLFLQKCEIVGWTSELACFDTLHDENLELDQSLSASFEDLLRSASGSTKKRFREQIQRNSEPAVFEAFFTLMGELIAQEVEPLLFGELLKIGIAQRTLLKESPVDWANNVAHGVLVKSADRISRWVKKVCDATDNHSNASPAEALARLMGRDWRAPRFIALLSSQSGDRDRYWERYDGGGTSMLLAGLTDMYLLRVDAQLERAFESALITEAQSTLMGSKKEHSAPNPKSKKKKVSSRVALIKSLIEGNVGGINYARELDKRGAKIPQKWLDDGCPTTHEAAYLAVGPWKHRIDTGRNNVKRRN